jgi:hypothetical protein
LFLVFSFFVLFSFLMSSFVGNSGVLIIFDESPGNEPFNPMELFLGTFFLPFVFVFDRFIVENEFNFAFL